MNQQRFDDSTLIRIFALHELHRLKEHGLTRGALLDYHSRYKLVFLLAHSAEYRKLGPFVHDIHQWQNLNTIYNRTGQRVIVQVFSSRRSCAIATSTLASLHVQGYFHAPAYYSTERCSWRRDRQLSPASNRFCAADAHHSYGAYPDPSGQRYFESRRPRAITCSSHSGEPAITTWVWFHDLRPHDNSPRLLPLVAIVCTCQRQ